MFKNKTFRMSFSLQRTTKQLQKPFLNWLVPKVHLIHALMSESKWFSWHFSKIYVRVKWTTELNINPFGNSQRFKYTKSTNPEIRLRELFCQTRVSSDCV